MRGAARDSADHDQIGNAPVIRADPATFVWPGQPYVQMVYSIDNHGAPYKPGG